MRLRTLPHVCCVWALSEQLDAFEQLLDHLRTEMAKLGDGHRQRCKRNDNAAQCFGWHRHEIGIDLRGNTIHQAKTDIDYQADDTDGQRKRDGDKKDAGEQVYK